MRTIQVLGTGCPKCSKLFEVVHTIVAESGIVMHVEKIEDMDEILKAGVMMTPALVVDGKVKVVGRIPSRDELKKLIDLPG